MLPSSGLVPSPSREVQLERQPQLTWKLLLEEHQEAFSSLVWWEVSLLVAGELCISKALSGRAGWSAVSPGPAH